MDLCKFIFRNPFLIASFRKEAGGRVLYQPGSIYWLSVAVGVLNSAMQASPLVIDTEPFEPKRALKTLEKYKVEVFFASPTTLSLMFQLPKIKKYNFSRLKYILSTGSRFGETLKTTMRDLLPKTTVLSFYGMTETTAPVTMELIHVGHPNAVGHLLPDSEIKIIDERGNVLGNGERGEIAIRKKEMFIGYYNDPDRTRETVDADGWIHSGDIGYFDDGGVLYVEDRKKDIILYRNTWVIPGDLEDKIEGLPGVKEVVVVGVPHEVDVEWPAAVVVKSAGSTVTEADVKNVVAKNFNEKSQLRGGVFFVDEIPKTYGGKYKRMEAKEIVIGLTQENVKK